MSSRVIAICDLCGREQQINVHPDGHVDWEYALRLEGWWRNDDLFDSAICGHHPRSVRP